MKFKRLARNAAELMTLSAQLQADGMQLELLTDPLACIYVSNGIDAMFFAMLAAGQIERKYIRKKILEGQVIAASKRNYGRRPKVINNSFTFVLALNEQASPFR